MKMESNKNTSGKKKSMGFGTLMGNNWREEEKCMYQTHKDSIVRDYLFVSLSDMI